LRKGTCYACWLPTRWRPGRGRRARDTARATATGDQQRLPGTFIIDAQGTVRYAYYGKHAGDQPDLEELVRWWQAANESAAATA
jgi:hypothetical protein